MTSTTLPEMTSNEASRPRYGWIAGIALSSIVIFLGVRWALGYPLLGPPRFNGYLMQSPDPVTNFTLINHSETPVSLRDFRGQVVVIYFGYAYCPDFCPAITAKLATALQQLKPSQREQVQVMMVTVDPERDTPALLGDYLAHFDPSFLGLTGTPDDILSVATQLGIFYEKRIGTSDTDYFVDHTTNVMVIDKHGYLRIVFPFSMPLDEMASDLSYLVRER